MMLLHSGENDIMMDATLSINHTRQAEKYAWPQGDSNLRVWLILSVVNTQSSIHHNIIFTWVQ